jgi:hypothetical protein
MESTIIFASTSNCHYRLAEGLFELKNEEERIVEKIREVENANEIFVREMNKIENKELLESK